MSLKEYKGYKYKEIDHVGCWGEHDGTSYVLEATEFKGYYTTDDEKEMIKFIDKLTQWKDIVSINL
jgi:hypothetical protein